MKTILIVDDEEDIELLMRQKFRKKIHGQELKFLFARDGKRALELVESEEPIDLVMTDINMPTMNGTELLMKIKQKSPHIQVLMVSAYTDQESMRLAKHAGADGSIPKPFDLTSLATLLEEAVR